MQRCPSLFGNTKIFERKHKCPYVEEWTNWSHDITTTMMVLSLHETKDVNLENLYWMTDTQKHITTYTVWHHLRQD